MNIASHEANRQAVNRTNFSNSMLFFTSNLGYSDAQQRSVPVGFMDEDARDTAIDTDIRKELRHAAPSERLCLSKSMFNRFLVDLTSIRIDSDWILEPD